MIYSIWQLQGGPDEREEESWVGASLPYFTTHHHLVEMQAAKRAQREASNRDLNWGKTRLQDETAAITSNE